MPSSLGSEDITMYIWRRESEAQQLVELQFAFSHFLHGRRHPHEPYSVYFRIFPIVPRAKAHVSVLSSGLSRNRSPYLRAKCQNLQGTKIHTIKALQIRLKPTPRYRSHPVKISDRYFVSDYY